MVVDTISRWVARIHPEDYLMKLRVYSLALLLAGLYLAASPPAAAWYLELRGAGQEGADAGLWLSNQDALSRAHVYLLWYDADAAEGTRFSSWQAARGWRRGLAPVTSRWTPPVAYAVTGSPARACRTGTAASSA
jgi:hypothetical protein